MMQAGLRCAVRHYGLSITHVRNDLSAQGEKCGCSDDDRENEGDAVFDEGHTAIVTGEAAEKLADLGTHEKLLWVT